MAGGPTEALRARSTRLLFTAAALGSSSLNAAFTVAPLVAADIAGSRAWSGIPGAASIAGTGLGAAVLTKVMARRGRGTGFRLGYALAVVGAVGAFVATRIGSLWLLILSMVLIGIGHAGTQLARFAAAELHPTQARARVLGWIVWASTVGALLGPLLPRPVEALGAFGDASGFVVAIVFTIGALAVAAALRPDPSALAYPDEAPSDEQVPSLRTMLRAGHARLALIAIVGAQAAMVLVMTITPLHVREAGHGLGTVGYVMSAHFIGMFALAPVAGRLVARLGSKPVIVAGLLVLALAAAAVGRTAGEHGPLVGVWLFLLGLGWSLTFVAASALLTTGLTYRARLHLQGSVDALSWTAAAVASASSGLTFARAGFDVLSYAGVAIALVPVLAVLTAGRRGRLAGTG